jgi:hypothetical protein
MKCRNSAFNAQGSRGIIVAVKVGAVKIYVAAAVEALRTTERQGEIDGFMSFNPLWVPKYLFCSSFFFESHPVYDQTQGTGAVFS